MKDSEELKKCKIIPIGQVPKREQSGPSEYSVLEAVRMEFQEIEDLLNKAVGGYPQNR